MEPSSLFLPEKTGAYLTTFRFADGRMIVSVPPELRHGNVGACPVCLPLGERMTELNRRGGRVRSRTMPMVAAAQGRRAVALPDGVSRREGKSLETQGKILDAAEELFSVHGLYGVTLRDIASKADVDTALLHY